MLEERIGLLLKQVACVVNTSLSLALFRERQIADFIKMQYHMYFCSFQNTYKTELKRKSPRKWKLTKPSKLACQPAPSKLIT